MIVKLKTVFSALILILRNILVLRWASSFPHESSSDVIYRGADKSEVFQVLTIYKKLNPGVKTSRFRRILYRLYSDRIILIATRGLKPDFKIIGINIYYLNVRDLLENTIHEGFIGVIPDEVGRGVATEMRRFAKSHFSKQGFKGISTRISISNHASLKSAQKMGFELVETKIDPVTNDERFYMVCKLEGNEF